MICAAKVFERATTSSSDLSTHVIVTGPVQPETDPLQGTLFHAQSVLRDLGFELPMVAGGWYVLCGPCVRAVTDISEALTAYWNVAKRTS